MIPGIVVVEYVAWTVQSSHTIAILNQPAGSLSVHRFYCIRRRSGTPDCRALQSVMSQRARNIISSNVIAARRDSDSVITGYLNSGTMTDLLCEEVI